MLQGAQTITDAQTVGDNIDCTNGIPGNDMRRYLAITKHHARPNDREAWRQLAVTAIPFVLLWSAMMALVNISYLATLLLAIPTAAFTVRLFILQHDCGHRSFFRSRRLNDLLGTIIGVITLTPHTYWRKAHNIHHTTCGNLEQRGIGDVSVLTVAEYNALSPWERLRYRLYRHPFVLFVIGPLYVFVLKYRLPLDLVGRQPRLLYSVMGTNAAIIGLFTALGLMFGFTNLLLVHFPVVMLSSAIGVWLFYIQHQFERTYWRAGSTWDFHDAAIQASSYYVLPQPLRWLSGDIGMHHIHHLACRIPSYHLAGCLEEMPELAAVNRIGLRDSLKCTRLALWDDSRQELISFSALRTTIAAT
ncbi:MAG: fatty acid desaturase [Magnetospiraceae bacterium]